MYKFNIKQIIVTFLILILAGCASYHPRVNTDHIINKNVGYIYGGLVFKLQDHGPFFGRGHVAIELKEINNSNELLLEIIPGNNVSIFEAEPGVYKISNIVYVYHGGQIAKKKSVQSIELSGTIEVKSKQATYIGSYEASDDISVSANIALQTNLVWRLSRYYDNYAQATNAFKNYHNNFSNMQVNKASLNFLRE